VSSKDCKPIPSKCIRDMRERYRSSPLWPARAPSGLRMATATLWGPSQAESDVVKMELEFEGTSAGRPYALTMLVFPRGGDRREPPADGSAYRVTSAGRRFVEAPQGSEVRVLDFWDQTYLYIIVLDVNTDRTFIPEDIEYRSAMAIIDSLDVVDDA